MDCKIEVRGEGPKNAKLVFVGEAPGRDEIKQGRPFVGRSGKLLRETLAKVGIEEKKVYITNVVKFKPTDGGRVRKPTRKEVQACLPVLEKELEIIQPEVICLLGGTAIEALLGKEIKPLKDHGRLVEREGRKYFVTIHPSAVIRFKKYKPLLEGDLEKLSQII